MPGMIRAFSGPSTAAGQTIKSVYIKNKNAILSACQELEPYHIIPKIFHVSMNQYDFTLISLHSFAFERLARWNSEGEPDCLLKSSSRSEPIR
jgi:hypothetical protein